MGLVRPGHLVACLGRIRRTGLGRALATNRKTINDLIPVASDFSPTYSCVLAAPPLPPEATISHSTLGIGSPLATQVSASLPPRSTTANWSGDGSTDTISADLCTVSLATALARPAAFEAEQVYSPDSVPVSLAKRITPPGTVSAFGGIWRWLERDHSTVGVGIPAITLDCFGAGDDL